MKEIFSDNGTNFTNGERELCDAISYWNQENIHNSLLQKNIKWSFNPPYGCYFEGSGKDALEPFGRSNKPYYKSKLLMTKDCSL